MSKEDNFVNKRQFSLHFTKQSFYANKILLQLAHVLGAILSPEYGVNVQGEEECLQKREL